MSDLMPERLASGRSRLKDRLQVGACSRAIVLHIRKNGVGDGLGPGLPTRMVCPSPLARTASALPHGSRTPAGGGSPRPRDWPHAFCRCRRQQSSPSRRTGAPRGAAGTIRRTFCGRPPVGAEARARQDRRQRKPRRPPSAPRRREISLVTCHSTVRIIVCRERVGECA